jgi:5'-nucleotidase
MEGAINGIRSVALSIASFVSGAPIHYETGAKWLHENWRLIAEGPHKELTFLNINIPSIAYPELEGHKVVAMGKRVYEDRVELRHDPWNRPYYWQGGVVIMDPDQPGTDVEAVNKGFVAITPVTLDWTDYAHADALANFIGKCHQPR